MCPFHKLHWLQCLNDVLRDLHFYPQPLNCMKWSHNFASPVKLKNIYCGRKELLYKVYHGISAGVFLAGPKCQAQRIAGVFTSLCPSVPHSLRQISSILMLQLWNSKHNILGILQDIPSNRFLIFTPPLGFIRVKRINGLILKSSILMLWLRNSELNFFGII